MTADAPGRRRLAPEVRRQQILDAAVAVFSERGYHGASMDDVAARAGVSKPVVYAHGGSKDDVFAACLQREADRLTTTMTAAVTADDEDAGDGGDAGGGDGGGEVRLRRGLRAFFHAVTTHRQGWTVLYRQASVGEFAGAVDAARRGIVLRAAELLAGHVGADVSATEPVAHMIVGAAEGLAEWWLAQEHPDADGDPADVLADMLMAVVWPGLDALTAGGSRQPIAPYPGVSGER